MRRGVGIVALTGASGFVGKALLRALLDAGYSVRALEHRSPLPAHPLLTTIRGALDARASLDALVAGADVVLHVGGLVLARRPSDFYRINTHATAQLAEAANAAGVKRFLFVSSLAAREPQLSAYAKSKRDAEGMFPGIAGMAWDILRPPAIYGPGDANSLPFLEMLSRGHVWLPVTRDAVVAMLHVDDLVAAMLAWLAMEHPPSQRTYEIADQAGGYRWGELISLAQAALQRPLRLHKIPRSVAFAAAAMMQFFAWLTGRPCFLTTDKLREMLHPNWQVNSTAFMAVTGWQPRVSLAQGLISTLEWYKKSGRELNKM